MTSMAWSGRLAWLGVVLGVLIQVPAFVVHAQPSIDPLSLAERMRREGTVVIEAPDSLRLSGDWQLPDGALTIRARGRLLVDDFRLRAPGARITLEGTSIHVGDAAHLDVARPDGDGGTVVLRASAGSVLLDASSSLDASGRAGRGGRVVLTGDDVRAAGALRALGRGRIEVEARGTLQFTARADTGGGVIRLDPTNMRIGSFGGTNTNVANSGGSPNVVTPTSGVGELDAGNLALLLATNDVIVHTTNVPGPVTGLESAITGDGTDGDIAVEASVVWTSAQKLYLLAHDDVIVRASVQGGSTGSVVAVAGWDGTTTTGLESAALVSTVYGAGNGDVFVVGDDVNPAPGTAFGSRLGGTWVWGRNVTVRGSNAASPISTNAFGQIGYRVDVATADPFDASGPIHVTAKGTVTVQGGQNFNNFRYAQIGHGGGLDAPLSIGASQGNLTGDITVTAVGALTLDDGIAQSYAQIGHGGLVNGFTRGNIGPASGGDPTSDIVVHAAAVQILSDDNAGHAQVGHGGSTSKAVAAGVQGNLSGKITVGTAATPIASLIVQSDKNGFAEAQIGHGGFNSGSTIGTQSGDIEVHVTGDAGLRTSTNLSGRYGVAQIGHGGPLQSGASAGAATGNVTVHVGGKLDIVGGGLCESNACNAQIGHGGPVFATGPTANGTRGVMQGDIDVEVGTVLTMLGGTGQFSSSQIGHGGALFALAGGAIVSGGAVGASGNITATAASASLTGGTGAGAYTQIGHGGLFVSCATGECGPGSGTITIGTQSGNIHVETTAGGLDVVAGDDNSPPIPADVSYAMIGHGFHPAATGGTESNVQGEVTVLVKTETSLRDDDNGSVWWIGHRTRASILPGSPVSLDTGTLDFAAAAATNATISDAQFWPRFAVNNVVGGAVTLRVRGLAAGEDDGHLVIQQPLTVPGGTTNPVVLKSTDDLTVSAAITNSGSSLIDLVADDANPGSPDFSATALLTIDGAGAIAGDVRLFAVGQAQFTPGGYSPPSTAFGVWYGPPASGSPVVGANFKLTPDPLIAKSHIVWRNLTTNQIAVWLMDGAAIVTVGATHNAIDPAWVIVGVENFTGVDNTADLLWMHTTNRWVSIWPLNGTTIGGPVSFVGTAAAGQTMAGVGDVDNDGHPDIVFRDAAGTVTIWFMNNTARTSTATLPLNPGADWTLVQVADFDGNGTADLLWRNRTSGQVAIWLLDGATVDALAAVSAVPLDWSIVGVGRLDNDGKADILWRRSDGQLATWFMDGTTIASTGLLPTVPADWAVVGVRDFNGDGLDDILWRQASGALALWRISPLLVTQFISTPAIAWDTVRVEPFHWPTITSANTTAFTEETPGTFFVTTTGFPAPAITRGGAALPAGVNFIDNGNGTATLSGSPADGTAGPYVFDFTASNGILPDATQVPFTLTIVP